MKSITEAYVEEVNRELWEEASTKYGSKFSVPSEDVQRMGEIIRGLHVLVLWQKEGGSRPPESALRAYSVLEGIIPEVLNMALGVTVSQKADSLKPEKREKKWNSFIAWAKLHESEQFTTEQLVEVCGFSYQTTLEFLKISPHFKKIKKGLYEVVNPKSKDK